MEDPGKAVPTGAFSSQGVLLPHSLSPNLSVTTTPCQETSCPTHCRAGWTTKVSWFREHGGEGAGSLPEPGLTFHAHAVIKTFVVEAAVVGRAEMFPEVAASSWQHSRHMWSAKLSGSSPPPRTESHWTGDPSYVWQSMPWCAIWCVSPPPSRPGWGHCWISGMKSPEVDGRDVGLPRRPLDRSWEDQRWCGVRLPGMGVPEVEPAEGGEGPQGSGTPTSSWTDGGTKALGGCRDSLGKPEASLPITVLLALTPNFSSHSECRQWCRNRQPVWAGIRFNNAKMAAFCRISCPCGAMGMAT